MANEFIARNGLIAQNNSVITGSLSIKATGATTSDLPFRVRNSADTANIITITGKGQIWSNGAGFISTNTSYGELALTANTTGPNNTAFGYNTLTTNTTSGENTGVGWGALQLTTGAGNTAIGYAAGQINAAGYNNVYLGYAAGQNGTTANNCIFIGYAAGQSSNATNGIFIGQTTSTTGGNGTVAIGNSAGAGTGLHNVSLGQSSGAGMTTGNFNLQLGYRTVASGVTTGNYNTLVGGDSVVGAVSNTAVLSDGAGNIAIRKDASHYVGIGYSGTATLGAKLDVKAQGALSTDIVFRVRNSADTSNLISVNGAGTTTITGSLIVTGGITGVPSGVFGISNSSGVYTYYATLTLAMTAATSGQVIEMFADVVETGAVTVTLKTGVNINGNGHTYTLNNTGTTNCIQDGGVAVYCEIFNIKFKRTGAATPSSTASLPLYTTNASTQIINNGVSYESTFSLAAAINGKITGGYFKGELANNLSLEVNGTLINADFYSSVGYAKINGTAINCSFRSDGGSQAVNSAAITTRLINCTGYSTAGYGISGTGYIFNCTGYSTAGSAIYTSDVNCVVENSSGYSTSVCGIQGTGDFINCVGESTANAGIFGTSIINCTAKSSAAKATWLAGKMYNSTSICTWNNASGYAVDLNITSTEIIECVLQVTNAAANIIYAGSASTCKYANNAFKGATTSINANVTQGIVNTHDNQGNIII